MTAAQILSSSDDFPRFEREAVHSHFQADCWKAGSLVPPPLSKHYIST